jgi:hypothetical protein
MKVRVVRLPEDCHGSADALRFLSRDVDEETNKEQQQRIIPKSSHLIVLPSDLILEGNLLNKQEKKEQCILSTLIQQHRQWTDQSAISMLFTDVGSEDKEGIPLKESSKAKLGRLARDEEDMEYVGLSSEIPPPYLGGLHSSSSFGAGCGRRVLLKRSKIEV